MDRVIIKPESKEIIFRGKPEDGHVDVFSYNYEPGAANGLGGLFIVGHVQPATEDTSYMINLVASLAKREYYAKSDAAPKDSFSKTLKKINEVLQDFFRNKDIKVNIGIFAVAGENIFISRLGKFKIILSRDNQNVDILNNINLFQKEHIQEKEFSNVISGKIIPQDKIFAYYPGRSIVAREKNIKADLLKLGADDFAEKLSVIKKSSNNFLCAGIHIGINRYTEPAVLTPPQPQELKTERTRAILTKTAKTAKEKPVVVPELPYVRPPEAEDNPIKIKEEIPTIRIEPAPIQPDIQPKPEEVTAADHITYPDNKNLEIPKKEEPSPLIRPSEFSSATKENFFSSILKKYKPSGVYVIGRQPFVSKKQLITIGSILMVLVLIVVAKFTFAPNLPIPVPGAMSPEEKAAEETATKAEAGLESAKTYINQNNLLEARKILRSYYEALETEQKRTEHINKIQEDIMLALDELDKAVDSTPSLFQEVIQPPSDQFQAWSFIWSLAKGGEVKIENPNLAGVGFYPYQNNLYILATDTIYKITDGLKGKTSAVAWLNKDVPLPVNPVSLAIDSKVYVINENGILTVYYKGDKTAEINTSIPVEKGSALLTTSDSSYLFLVDKVFGRIYIMTKESGNLLKTLKLNNQEPVLDVAMADDGTLYFLSKDNKVWKVTP